MPTLTVHLKRVQVSYATLDPGHLSRADALGVLSFLAQSGGNLGDELGDSVTWEVEAPTITVESALETEEWTHYDDVWELMAAIDVPDTA